MTVASHPRHLRRNDRIVFLGDSITEAQLYTNYVETYLVTRYPELNLTFFNVGWGGELAPVALTRLDRDVLSLKPTVVTICYGMNDGRYVAYTPEIGASFSTAMRTLVKRLRAEGIRVVLLTPGAVDTKVSDVLRKADYNASLRTLADSVVALAKRNRIPCADLHALMLDVDRKGKKADPAFTLAPVDGVHPNPAGHLVMAYGVLQALGVPPRNDRAEVDLGGRRPVCSPGVKARLRQRNGRADIELTLARLPYFVDPAARAVLSFLPFQQTFNRLQLRVSGSDGRESLLRVNHQRKGRFGPRVLSAGLELFDIWQSDPMRDSARAGGYVTDKDHVFYRIWRGLALNAPPGLEYDRPVFATGVRLSLQSERTRASFVRDARMRIPVSVDTYSARGETVDEGDFIATWGLRGPFGGNFGTDFLGGEAEASASIPTRARGWTPHVFALDDFGSCLDRLYGQLNFSCVYAVAILRSPVKQRCELLIGSDDGFAAWLNGTLLESQLFLPRGVTIDQNRMPVTLTAGVNVLLLKISQYGATWGFCARFAGLTAPLVVETVR